jgi:hypothetical protein
MQRTVEEGGLDNERILATMVSTSAAFSAAVSAAFSAAFSAVGIVAPE